MADAERKFHPSPEDLTKLRTSVDALVRRGVAREEARGLLEIFQDGHTWGLPEDHVAASRRILRGFLERPYFFPEDVQEFLEVVKQEERSARVNWDLRKKNASALAGRLSRLVVLAGLVTGGAFSVPPAVSTLGELYYQAFLSPEAIARAQEENLQKQAREAEEQSRKQQEALLLEQKATLGLDWSVESSTGWKIRYLPTNPNVEYQEVDYRGGSRAFGNGYFIKLASPPEESSVFNEEDNLGIYARTYQKSDKTKIPKLDIQTVNSAGYSIDITIYLRNEPLQDVDTRVVHAYRASTQTGRYLKITVVPGREILQVNQMVPVKR